MMKFLCGVIVIVLSIFFKSAAGVAVLADPDQEGHGHAVFQTLNEQSVVSQRLNLPAEDDEDAQAELENMSDPVKEMGVSQGKI